MGQKRAVLVGINYPGTDGELKGCLNDVARMRRCLADRFGFDEAGIRVLADADPSTPPPTGANIRRELERLVAGARAGDTLFFHYSGHGLQLPAETGDDECIVPCDLNLIKDQDFTELVAKVPDGCLFTMVSDSCHSGGLIDKTKEQIGNSTKQNKKNQQHRAGDTKPPSASGTCTCSCSCSCSSLLRIIRGAVESLGVHLPCHGRRHGHKQSTQTGGKETDAKTEAEPSTIASATTTSSRSLPLPTFIEMLRDKTGRHHFGHDAVPPLRPRRQPQGQEVREGHGGQAPARRQAGRRGSGAVARPQGGPGAGRAERRGGVRRGGGGGQGRAAPERRPDQRVPDGRDLGGRDHARRRVLRRAEQRDLDRPRREQARGGGGDEPGAGGQGAGAAGQAGVHAAARALLQRRARQAALHLLNCVRVIAHEEFSGQSEELARWPALIAR